MKGSKFYIRVINLCLVLLILMGYEMAAQAHENQAEEARLEAELKAEKAYSEEILAQIGDTAGETQEKSRYKDGNFYGEARGYGGTIEVEVVIADGMIEEVNILSAKKEDEPYFSMAKKIVDEILEEQSADVDTISSATYSSTGIKNAVIQALNQAVNDEENEQKE